VLDRVDNAPTRESRSSKRLDAPEYVAHDGCQRTRASFVFAAPSFDLDRRFAGGELVRHLSAYRHARDNAIQHSGRHAKHSILALAATSLTVANYDNSRFVSKKPTDGMTVNA
jgi:hypothetical protein